MGVFMFMDGLKKQFQFSLHSAFWSF